MKQKIKIGNKEYESKKNALNHYKQILNSYQFGEILNANDFDDLFYLLVFDYSHHQIDNKNESNNTEATAIEDKQIIPIIVEIKVTKVQFDTKCFEVIWSDNFSEYISYISIINRPKYSADMIFSKACRNAIQDDLIRLKQSYFKNNAVNGYVKCQETSENCMWDDVVVDHRQPNTLSMIIERFKEVKSVDISCIEYVINIKNQLFFKDENLLDEFINYHKLKANLRIIKKENNSKRTGMARVKQTSKDLKIL